MPPDEWKLREALLRATRLYRDPDLNLIMDSLCWYMGQPKRIRYKPGKKPPKISAAEKRRIFMRSYMRDYRKGIRRRKKEIE